MKKMLFVLFCMLLIVPTKLIAATVPNSQSAGGVAQQEETTKKLRGLEQRIETPVKNEEERIKNEILNDESGSKVLISTITVEGVTLLKDYEWQAIVAPYENKELTMKSIQMIADLISDKYRQKGYVTSRAYIPPQNIKEGKLIIRVVEGKLGSVKIEGNRYFRTNLLKRMLNLKENEALDYLELQSSLSYINEAPDRFAKAILVPGQAPGTTDIVIKVEDKLPIHIGYEYDNYGSRFIYKNRYSAVLEDNNLFGFDDRFSAKLQYAERELLQSQNYRYIFPINKTWDVGAYYADSRVKLARDYTALHSLGKSSVIGLYTKADFYKTPETVVSWNLGFDAKKFIDELGGIQISRDDLRVLKTGFDFDKSDKWGRSIFTTEIDAGLPIMGASDPKDPNASRTGAGSQFQKWLFNFFRLQPMAFDSAILWKNTAQYSNHNLVAAEQFQIGGATSVRAYSPAEYSGDMGYYTAFEWSCPVYFIPKTINVPHYKTRLYDALRLVAFYDWASIKLNTVQPAEQKYRTLKGYGTGLRFNVTNDIAIRYEIGFPIGKRSTDGQQAHHWVEVNLKF
ncbi:MAG: ShlB/FhaC/HecB family hemolysin secretion/activation protein [Candidatus Omnitrophica bacterium]|nr:ShlB/FhaC/HecB family hemolysin secretion/activation protein [Candidatus Omnitrophota bacterium]